MAATSSLRPVGHGERLTLTGHLTELRARLVVCALALTVLFAGCLWQSRPLLDVLNRPLSTVSTAGSGLPARADSARRALRSRAQWAGVRAAFALDDAQRRGPPCRGRGGGVPGRRDPCARRPAFAQADHDRPR